MAGILRMIKLPDGRVRILVQGLARARIDFWSQEEPYLRAHITRLEEPVMPAGDLEVEAFVRTLRGNLEKVVELGKTISPEVMLIATSLDDGSRLADLVASNLTLRPDESQRVLETMDLKVRMRTVNEMLEHEIALLEVQRQISNQVQGEMDRNQREYLLRQQLRQIQKELGETDDMDQEVARYREILDTRPLSEEAKDGVQQAAQAAAHHARRVGRGGGHPHLPRLAHRPAVGHLLRGRPGPRPRAHASSTRTTTTSRR